MIRSRTLFSTMIVGCFLSPLAAGGSLDYNTKWTHYGVRPLAMGNAFVSVADDFNALFYNPAGLARLKEWDGEFLNPSLEMSKDTSSFISDLSDLAGGSASDSKAVLNLIEKNTGKNHHAAFGLTPHLIFPNFGFAIGTEVDLSLTFHRYPSAFLDAGPRIVIPIGFGLNFLENRLAVGASVKTRIRGGIYHEFSIEDMSAFEKGTDADNSQKLEKFLEGGYGFGTDFGILFTPMEPMKPTLGLSVTDFGGTTYTQMDIGGKSAGTPENVLPSLNVGVSFRPIENDRMYLMTALDMHSINQPFDHSKKWNLGLEWGLGSLFKVQTGLHQGYLSGGFELDVGLLALRFASYAEEKGNVAGKAEDRRYLIQIKLLI